MQPTSTDTGFSPSLHASPTGVVHRWTRSFIPTTKDAPAEAQAVSHRLLLRGGFIRQVGAGIYDYLPLGWRVLQRVSAIVREEMDRTAGAIEMLMPALEPFELFEGTKRDVDYGDNLFRLKDRHGRMTALAPTHEEVITELMKGGVTSYRQLPLSLYQIQTKFRDEFRPRSGLLRCREFLMKDAYSFHMHVEGPGGLDETYDAMDRAYQNIFRRCGLTFTRVEAESGPIGGSASHEFMVNCESGEDTVLTCPASGYAANVEKCEIGPRPHDFNAAPSGDLTEVHTPGLPGIDEVGKFMKVKPERMLKVVLFEDASHTEQHRELISDTMRLIRQSGAEAAEGLVKTYYPDPVQYVLAVVRGDHEVNLGKVKQAHGKPLVLADPDAARRNGFPIGFMSPRMLMRLQGDLETQARCRLLIDPDAAQGGFWATGADKMDYHVKHFNWRREMGSALDDAARVKVADIRNAAAGDPSPRAPGSRLEARKGIEVGHIFKLGTKYSDAMDFRVLDEKQERRSVIMGCYGIGVSRTMAACVEMSHDENGIIWPAAIAPYHVVVTPMKTEAGSDAMRIAESLAADLSAAGLDVLIDDRDERPGVKFKDADLIGVPLRLTLGDKALAEKSAEFKRRNDPGKGEMAPLERVVGVCLAAVRE